MEEVDRGKQILRRTGFRELEKHWKWHSDFLACFLGQVKQKIDKYVTYKMREIVFQINFLYNLWQTKNRAIIWQQNIDI